VRGVATFEFTRTGKPDCAALVAYLCVDWNAMVAKVFSRLGEPRHWSGDAKLPGRMAFGHSADLQRPSDKPPESHLTR
jgi:hypothetical protein